jgi:RNA polymerase sigma-70 factor (sigma-E family)
VSVDRGGFADFYQEAKDDCLRAVAASIGDRQAAEDAVAEAFARAWSAWRRVRVHPEPRAWVVRTALNANVSWWRRHRHEMLSPGRNQPGPAPDPSERADGLDVMAALRRLPARQREVIALRFLLDLDTARTAEVLGIAPGTVTAHLARGIATLRAALITSDWQETAQ